MAKNSIDINVNLTITDKTAITLLQLLETYCNDKGLCVTYDITNLNGDIQLTFTDNIFKLIGK
jgi:hypothetical protein